MTTVFADTSYYLALVNSLDEHHAAAEAFTRDYDGSCLTTAWVITELANSLSQMANRRLFLSLLGDLRDDPNIVVIPPTEDVYERGLRLYAGRIDKNWSLTDCISFVVMEEHHLQEALTSDHHFEQAGFRCLLR